MGWHGYKLYLSLGWMKVDSILGAAEPAIKFDLDAVRHNGLSRIVEHEREISLTPRVLRRQAQKGTCMRIVYQRCCGMDVHKDSITACVLLLDEGGEFRGESRRFGTMTRPLKEMAAWLASEGVEAIAMEATGVYWKPVWNILEAEKKCELLLVKAQHGKQVPGRKTDQKDSEWIAELLQHGLLRASFVPPQTIRRLRDLTRMRVKVR